jgi:hypothetical protein
MLALICTLAALVAVTEAAGAFSTPTLLTFAALPALVAAAPSVNFLIGNLNSATFTIVVSIAVIVYFMSQWIRFWSFDGMSEMSGAYYARVRAAQAGTVTGAFGWFSPWWLAVLEWIGRVLLVISFILFLTEQLGAPPNETWYIVIAVLVLVAGFFSQLGGACFWQLSQFTAGGCIDVLETLTWIAATVFIFIEIFNPPTGSSIGDDVFLVIVTIIWIFFAAWRAIDKCSFASVARRVGPELADQNVNLMPSLANGGKPSASAIPAALRNHRGT